MSNTLKHKKDFTGFIPDSPDTTRLRPSDWSTEHVFSGGSDTQILQRDSGQTDGASWTGTPTLTTATVQRSGIGVVSTDGFILSNPTAATAGVPVQYSPRLRFSGTAWNSVGGVSETDQFALELRPLTIAGATKARLYFMSSIAGGAFVDKGYFNSDGSFVGTHQLAATDDNGEVFVGNNGFIYWFQRASLTSTADKKVRFSNNAVTTGAIWDVSVDGTFLARNFNDSADGQIAGASVRGNPVTVANLPAVPVKGMLATVTDATVTTSGTTVVGSGTHNCLVWYNGTNWIIVVGT